MTMWQATSRYELEPAPGGLAFVHDLLSTAAAGKPRAADLLADQATAQDWLDSALAAWADATGRTPGQVTLTARDTTALRGFRDSLRRQMAALPADGAPSPGGGDGGHDGKPLLPSVSVTLQPDLSGEIHAEPRGNGWHQVAALAMIEIFQAQRAGTWPRLKVCRNHKCAGAFYDRSRNNSGVWHDVHVCGNQANLRAYRARQRSGRDQ